MNAPQETRAVLNTAGFAHPPRNVAALDIQPGMMIADFGSGSGAYVFAIAEKLSGKGEVYAVDVQRDLLRKIHNEAHKRGLTSVRIIWGDLEKPTGSKLLDRSCDLVLISNLLFQIDEKARLFEEAGRILKPDGRLAIIDWQDSFGGMGPIDEKVVTKDAALQLAKDAGMGLEKEFEAGEHHYGLVLSFKGRQI